MAEHNENDRELTVHTETVDRHPEAPPARRRRGPDVLTLLMALICLTASTMALTGWMPAMPATDPRWVLAGGAILVGLLLLAASLRSPGRSRKNRR